MRDVPVSETEAMARIERLELDVRDLRRRIEHAPTEEDRKVLDRQIRELTDEIAFLARRLRA